MTYTLTLNVVGGTASNIQVQEMLSNSLVFQSGGTVPAGGIFSFYGPSSLTWNWASLAPGTYNGTYQVSVAGTSPCGTVLGNSGSFTFPGQSGSVSAASVTVQCLIATPTKTPVPSVTPGKTPVIYPNPSDGDRVRVMPPPYSGVSDVRVQVFTMGFRKVQEGIFSQVPEGTPVQIDLQDDRGTILANGLYYIRVSTVTGNSIGKLMIIR